MPGQRMALLCSEMPLVVKLAPSFTKATLLETDGVPAEDAYALKISCGQHRHKRGSHAYIVGWELLTVVVTHSFAPPAASGGRVHTERMQNHSPKRRHSPRYQAALELFEFFARQSRVQQVVVHTPMFRVDML
jgi:hypothetical protein